MFIRNVTFVIVLMAALLMACVPAAGQIEIHGSGTTVTQSPSIDSFDRVRISQAFQVDIRQGDEFDVLVRVDEALVEYLRVRKVGETLEIGLKQGQTYDTNGAKMTAEVTMPTLRGLELNGASQATIAGFESHDAIKLDLSGASSLVGEIGTGEITIDLSGASRAALSGHSRTLKVETSGASNANLGELQTTDAEVEASGASEVSVSARTLRVKASGAAQISFGGDPTIDRIETSGSASLIPR